MRGIDHKTQVIGSIIAMVFAIGLFAFVGIGYYRYDKANDAQITSTGQETNPLPENQNHVDEAARSAGEIRVFAETAESIDGIWKASDKFGGEQYYFVLVLNQGTITYYAGTDDVSYGFAGTYTAWDGWPDRFDIIFTEGSEAKGYTNPYQDAILSRQIKAVIEVKRASGQDALEVVWIDGQVEVLFQTRYQEQMYEYASNDPGRW